MLKKTALLVALLALAACAAADRGAARIAETEMAHEPHIISVKSNADFDQTLAQLTAAIDARGFKTFAVIDHAKGAASIGAELRPTTLVIFGSPKGGTPLMQAEQRLGLELPLKMLVAESENGAVYLVYPGMAHVFDEYGVSSLSGPLTKLEGALAAIAAEAAAPMMAP